MRPLTWHLDLFRVRSRLPAIALLLFAAFGFSRTARAAVCIELDATRDNLAETERSATRPLLERAFESNNEHVATTGCTATYRVYHVKLGQSITVVLSGPNGSRELRVSSIEEVPDAYSQLVKSLLTGQPLGAEGTAMDRTNVTSNQISPNRVTADSLFYLRLGYASIFSRTLTTGPTFGLGVRRELDRIAIDLSFLNVTATKHNDEYQNSTGSLLKLMVLYYFDPYANHSLYAGAGLGWGWTTVYENGDSASNTGLSGELSVGYEMLRVSTIRLLVQADATLPTYSASTGEIYGDCAADSTTCGSSKRSYYAPTIGLSFGLGFGRANTLVVK